MNNELTSTIKATLGIKDGRSRRAKLSPDFVISNLTLTGFPYRGREIATGIMWAYRTGRLVAQADMKIRNMNALQFINLIGEVSENCKTQNDIPGYLNK